MRSRIATVLSHLPQLVAWDIRSVSFDWASFGTAVCLGLVRAYMGIPAVCLPTTSGQLTFLGKRNFFGQSLIGLEAVDWPGDRNRARYAA